MVPTVNLPFGEGKAFLAESRFAHTLLGDWSITAVVTFQSGFPIGVSQNLTGTAFLLGGTPRPNIVPGVDFLVSGDITGRIRNNTGDNLHLNKAAFATSPANQFGNAPRTLPGVYSPWRNNVDLSVAKAVRTGGRTSLNVRIEVLNLLNLVQWAAPANNSGADFTTAAPAPRNSSVIGSACGSTLTVGGAATPNPVLAGNALTVTAIASPALLPPSTGVTVVANLLPVGGTAATPLFDDGISPDATAGDNVFTTLVFVLANTVPGHKSIAATASDVEGRNATTAFTVVVEEPPVIYLPHEIQGAGLTPPKRTLPHSRRLPTR